MKSADHPIHTRLPKGLEGQKFIKPLIENHIQEPLVMTACEYDTMDAYSENYWIEMKRRSDNYDWDHPLMKQGVLIPSCKIKRASREKKTVRFYYYYDRSNTLWYWDYNKKDLESCLCQIPSWHRDKQEHWYVPQRFWSSV